jgi:hypothetical protein
MTEKKEKEGEEVERVRQWQAATGYSVLSDIPQQSRSWL